MNKKKINKILSPSFFARLQLEAEEFRGLVLK